MSAPRLFDSFGTIDVSGFGSLKKLTEIRERIEIESKNGTWRSTRMSGKLCESCSNNGCLEKSGTKFSVTEKHH